MKKLLISFTFLLFVTPCFAQEVGTYYVIIETDGTVLRVCNVKECSPNDNEKRRFKVITVDLGTEQEYYDFVNSVLGQEVNPDGSYKPDGKLRANVIDTKTIAGDSEKVDLNVLETKIQPNTAVIDNP